MKRSTHAWLLTLGLLVMSCANNEGDTDASGTFEATETIISAEVSGIIIALHVQEGQALKKGDMMGFIDTTQLHLQRKQLQAQIHSLLSQRPDIDAQLATLRVQLRTAEREQTRIANLAAGGAATSRQVDDATAHVETIKRQIAASESALSVTTRSIEEQTAPLRVQIAQVEDRIRRCRLVSPIDGKVLTKYAETHEMATPGKPLLKLADLSTMILRAYISGEQLSSVKLGQQTTVFIDDDGREGRRAFEGRITWISDEAEFTPKTIQTKEERANLVYAIKVAVPNDGMLKIGMYGDVRFLPDDQR